MKTYIIAVKENKTPNKEILTRNAGQQHRQRGEGGGAGAETRVFTIFNFYQYEPGDQWMDKASIQLIHKKLRFMLAQICSIE